MAQLKTDYKDQLLDSSANTKRVYNLVDSDGNVVAENVSLEDVTVYSQSGDTFGATDINKTNEKVNQLNNNLGGLRFGVDGDGNYGYYGADDSLVPFKSKPDRLVLLNGYLTTSNTSLFFDTLGYTKMDITASGNLSVTVRNKGTYTTNTTNIDVSDVTSIAIDNPQGTGLKVVLHD